MKRILLSFVSALTIIGCTTTTVAPVAPPVAEVPEYVGLPHPVGYGISDLKMLLNDPQAPRTTELKGCDKDFRNLLAVTSSRQEIQKGVQELVARNTKLYHWCFYEKIAELNDSLTADSYIDERQKQVIEAYEFLTPVARAFMDEFWDSRYIRWAVKDYRRVSEWVFFRKLDLSPEMSVELVDVGSSFGTPSAERQKAEEKGSVLDKYQIATDAPKKHAMPKALPATEPDDKDLPTPPDSDRAPASSKK